MWQAIKCFFGYHSYLRWISNPSKGQCKYCFRIEGE